MRKIKAGILVMVILYASLNTLNLNAEELRSSDSTYILEIDNNGLGYENNDPSSSDQTNTYKLTGNLEVFDNGYGDSTGAGAGNYRMKTGLQATFEANVPELSLFSGTDGSIDLYDRLLIEIDPNNNPTSADGALFAIQVSQNSNFTTYNYVNPNTFQIDAITNSDLSIYYRPCAETIDQPADDTRWDCGNISNLKRYVKGLAPNQTYYARAVAMNGDFTNSEPGPSLSASTSELTATFTLSTNDTTFGILSVNSVSTASPATTVTVDTNSQAGYGIYISGQGDGVSADSSLYAGPGKLIPSTSGNLTAGTAGYGLQAVSTVGSAVVETTWDVAGNTVGKLSRSSELFFSKDPSDPSFTIEQDQVTVNYKAAISFLIEPDNLYQDVVTYTMQVSPYNPI